MEQEDVIVQAKKLLQESPSERFWKYLRDHNVLEVFQPALTLLYQMPIKPENLYEFLAEFLENGAVDLLKISQLKSELCIKHDELEELHRNHPDVWTTEDFNNSADIRTSSSTQLRTSISDSDAERKKSIDESRNVNNADLFSFPLTDDEDFDKIERKLKLRKTDSIFTEKIFRLSDFDARSYPSLHSAFGGSVTKIEAGKKSSLKNSKKTPSTEKVNSKEAAAAAEVLEIKTVGKHEENTNVNEIQTTPDNPDPVTNLHPLSKSRQIQRISRLVSGIQDSDDRHAMENVLNDIADRKRMDPWGILFDFSRRNAERAYEMELYACGTPEAYLRLLSEEEMKNDEVTDSDLQLDSGAGGDAYEGTTGEAHENENEAEEGDMEEMEIHEAKEAMQMQMQDDKLTNEKNENEESSRNISTSEAKKLLHDQNRLRMIRDGLQFIHDVRKSKNHHHHHHKDRQSKRSQNLSIRPQTFLEENSDSDSVLSDDNLERKRTDLFLRSYADSYGECLSTEIKSGKRKKSSEPKFYSSPSIVIHHVDNDDEIVVVPETVKPSSTPYSIPPLYQVPPVRKRLKDEELRVMIGELFVEYRHHLEELQTQNIDKQILNSIYVTESPEEYVRKIENRFQALMKEKRNEALIGIYQRLLKILKKERKYHLRRLIKKREKCKKSGAKYEGYSDSYAETDDDGEDEAASLLKKIKNDFGLKNLEATQRWIDRTFKESWTWGPRKTCRDDKIASDYDKSESWIDVCGLTHDDDQAASGATSLNPRIDTAKTAETFSSNAKTTDRPCENTESLNALLNIYTRPKPNVVSYLKRSEWTRKYVERTFNPELKAKLLKHFPFEMFDDD